MSGSDAARRVLRRGSARFLWWCVAYVLPTVASASETTEVVVVATPEYGPSVTQFFEAVVQARLPDVRVNFVPWLEWQQRAAHEPLPSLVFLLDTSDSAEWKLGLVYQGQVFRRSIEGGLERDRAAVEAAALIAARTGVALLTSTSAEATDKPAELEAWASEPPSLPAPAPAPKAPATRPLPPKRVPPAPVRVDSPTPGARNERESETWSWSIGIGYRGSSYASDHPWTHGAALALGFRLPRGFGAELGYAKPLASDVATSFGSFSVSRDQFELLLSYAHSFAPLVLVPKLGVLWEWSRRSQTSPAPGVGSSDASSSLSFALGGVLELRYQVTETFSAFAGAGAQYLAKGSEYGAEGVSEPLLAPYRLRWVAELGAVATFD